MALGIVVRNGERRFDEIGMKAYNGGRGTSLVIGVIREVRGRLGGVKTLAECVGQQVSREVNNAVSRGQLIYEEGVYFIRGEKDRELICTGNNELNYRVDTNNKIVFVGLR